VQAFLIVQDPYANSYYLKWRKPSALPKHERMLGRGGWVATRNYELMSVAALTCLPCPVALSSWSWCLPQRHS
jgi:hypothetical protein